MYHNLGKGIFEVFNMTFDSTENFLVLVLGSEPSCPARHQAGTS
jgi:hypothetical protein